MRFSDTKINKKHPSIGKRRCVIAACVVDFVVVLAVAEFDFVVFVVGVARVVLLVCGFVFFALVVAFVVLIVGLLNTFCCSCNLVF